MKTVEIQGKIYTTEEAHRKLWNWLAEEVDDLKTKKDFFEEFNISEIPDNGCYACGECDGNCEKCPIKWSEDQVNSDYKCLEEYSLYNKWYYSYDVLERSALAKQIAELPWKEGRWE